MRFIIKDTLLEIITDHFLTISQVAKLTGTSFNTAKKCLSKEPVTISVAQKFCNHFKCNFKDIFEIYTKG